VRVVRLPSCLADVVIARQLTRSLHFAVPQTLLKIVWGLGIGAGAYLALRRLEALATGRHTVARGALE